MSKITPTGSRVSKKTEQGSRLSQKYRPSKDSRQGLWIETEYRLVLLLPRSGQSGREAGQGDDARRDGGEGSVEDETDGDNRETADAENEGKDLACPAGPNFFLYQGVFRFMAMSCFFSAIARIRSAAPGSAAS